METGGSAASLTHFCCFELGDKKRKSGDKEDSVEKKVSESGFIFFSLAFFLCLSKPPFEPRTRPWRRASSTRLSRDARKRFRWTYQASTRTCEERESFDGEKISPRERSDQNASSIDGSHLDLQPRVKKKKPHRQDPLQEKRPGIALESQGSLRKGSRTRSRIEIDLHDGSMEGSRRGGSCDGGR